MARPMCGIFDIALAAVTVLAVSAPACNADTVYMKDGTQIKGVVLNDGADDIQFWAKGGDRLIKRSDIGNIVHDTDEENILMMADGARAVNDNVRAYYLYEKAFRLNTDSKRAIEGMTALQGALNKNNAADQMVTYNQRYGTENTPMMDDKEVLSQNADHTEQVAKDLGMLLGQSNNKSYYRKIKVLDSIRGSRSDKAGVEIDDYVVGVDGRPTDYIGLFSAVDLLMGKADVPVQITIERDRSVWLNDNAGLKKNSLMERAGFSIDRSPRGFVITNVVRGSMAAQAGLRPGDRVMKVNNITTRDMDLEDFLAQVDKIGPSYVDIVVQRDVTL